MPVRAVLRQTQIRHRFLEPVVAACSGNVDTASRFELVDQRKARPKEHNRCPPLKAVQDVTDRIAARSADHAPRLSRPHRGGRAQAASTARRSPAATSPTASPPARRPTRPSSPAPKRRTSASSPPTTTCCARISPIETYPDIIKEAAREAGATAQVAGGVPAHVRRRHPGPAGHGPVAVLPRRHRHGDGDRAQPQHVRRGGLSRHLRQDRAGPADRRAHLRPPAGRVHPGRADALRHPQ